MEGKGYDEGWDLQKERGKFTLLDVAPSVGESDLCNRLVVTPVTQLQFLAHGSMSTSEKKNFKTALVSQLRRVQKKGPKPRIPHAVPRVERAVYPIERARPR